MTVRRNRNHQVLTAQETVLKVRERGPWYVVFFRHPQYALLSTLLSHRPVRSITPTPGLLTHPPTSPQLPSHIIR